MNYGIEVASNLTSYDINVSFVRNSAKAVVMCECVGRCSALRGPKTMYNVNVIEKAPFITEVFQLVR
eukprot:m.38919 g.38919  ORF g.38919 m.38919 type:complete len:67 (-) comp10263_c0_seq1:1679-1879(-)